MSDLQSTFATADSIWLLERFRTGDEAAAAELFDRFSQRLASLVQSRLSRKLARRLDAEDVVLSAYRSFFVRARDGQFVVTEPGDLWRLLAQITLNKLYRSAEWHGAARRTTAREQVDLADLANLASRDVSPELAICVADELEFLSSQLTDATSHVLELRLQGCDVDEIAALISRSPRTVRRQLETIRATFAKHAEVQSSQGSATEKVCGAKELERGPVAVERRSLDEFVLRRQIGLGLTGRVYEAFDKRQQQLVAVKVLRRSLLADQSLRQRFEAEAGIVALLNHPGIVRIHGQGETPNRGWFLVMDLLPGGDLSQFAGPSLSVEQAVDWIRDVAAAVGHAHGRGVIHCDLKPANLLLSKDDRVIVTDFGFARFRERINSQAMCIAGTPAFMAPEQMDLAGDQVGPPTDIYGLGAVLFFLLTGQPPVIGTNIDEILTEITSRNVGPDVTALRSDVPSKIAVICRRCLSKVPGDRFQNTMDLLETLR